jgi:hypothetical protein
MYEALNMDENKNELHNLSVIYETFFEPTKSIVE